MNLSADLLRGYTDPIILPRLEKKDGYGYQISREVSALSGGRVELKEATLYTAFRRMETAGLIESYWGNEAIGARRRYYHLTENGRKQLAEERTTWRENRAVLDQLLKGEEQ